MPVKMEMTEWKGTGDLLPILAKYCVANNFYRKGNEYHHLTRKDVKEINKYYVGELDPWVLGGYIFLDDNGGEEGMIRLYSPEGNPKWSFWEEDGKMMVDMA